nr:RidA family protein [Achromobacter sp. Marseille-Q0513]
MSRTVINPDTVFNSVQYGFSQAVVVTGSRRMLLSGQVGIDVHERTVGPGLQEQTEAALDNIERVLAAAGGRIDQVIMLRIYICETAREDQ